MAISSENPFVPLEAASGLEPVRADDFSGHISVSARVLEKTIRDIAVSELPVLMIGESGTGKRTLARRIHQLSSRSKLNLAEIEASELKAGDFGPNGEIRMYGAVSGGAHAGTLILHEVSLLSRDCQGRLYEWLTWSLEFDETVRSAAPRLIFTTNSNLEQEVRAGRYREDLYYRMSGLCVRVPPLRHRKEDIATLSDSFLGKYATLLQCPKRTLSDATSRFLAEYAWPGNIRELEDATRTIAALGDEKLAITALKANHRNWRRHSDKSTPVSLKEASKAASQAAERELILKVLSQTRWNRKRAAGELKISYKALLYKLKQMGVHDPHGGAQ